MEGLAVTLELLHPITHGGKLHSRGVHRVDAELAKLFLSFRDPISKSPIAKLAGKDAVTSGTVELDRTHPAYAGRPE